MSNISILGLGYVGSVSLACLADNNHVVIGVDVSQTKVDMITAGRSPIIEAGLDDLLRNGVAAGRIRATTDTAVAVCDSDVTFICVGTPSHHNGSLNLSFVQRVCEDVGKALASKETYHVVVARSTMLPGSTEDLVIPALEEASGKKAGRDFGVVFNPEFLREGSSIKDFYDPPYTIFGSDDSKAIGIASSLYAFLKAPTISVPFKVAEMIKYANNSFHALKVSFANEIGNICKYQDIDSHQVMDIVCRDTKLNLSPYYMKPGFAFGGSCLPKDIRALLYHGRAYDAHLPLLSAILPSNRHQIDIAIQMIRESRKKRIGVLGFSFKAGTDDLRESPIVELIEYIIGKGYEVKLYDKNVSLASLHGANRAYIEQEIPHIATLMADSMAEVLAESDVIVIGNKSPEFSSALDGLRPDQVIIDLVRIVPAAHGLESQYCGICW